MQLPVTDVGDNGQMDELKPSIETLDDTPIDPHMAESDVAPETMDSETMDSETMDSETNESSVELAIETLAGVDAAEAPDLADEVATRLRAQLSDS